MNKIDFLNELENRLSGLPADEVGERLSFYGEMIDDRIEEGMTEEEAVASIGDVETVVNGIVSDIPLSKLVAEKIKPKRTLKGWEIALIILGFPLWLPLLIAAGAVVLSLYVVAWSLIVSLWAVEVSFAVSAIGSLVCAVAFFIKGSAAQGVVMIGVSLLMAGLSIFLFFGCVAATRGILRLTKKAALGIKSWFIKKENTK